MGSLGPSWGVLGAPGVDLGVVWVVLEPSRAAAGPRRGLNLSMSRRRRKGHRGHTNGPRTGPGDTKVEHHALSEALVCFYCRENVCVVSVVSFFVLS